jgi:MFS family permease
MYTPIGNEYNSSLIRIYLLIFLFSLSVSVTFIAIPLLAYSLNASQLEIGLLGSVYTGIQIPLSIYFGKLSDKIGRVKLLTISLMCASFSMVLLTLNNSLLLLFFIRGLGGLAAAIFWPVSGALSADKAPGDKMVKVMGLSSVAFGISSIIGPSISGLLIDYFQNFTTTFLVGTAISLASYPVLLSLSRIDGKIQKSNYDTQQKSSKIGTTLDKREKTVLAWSMIAIVFYGFTSGGLWNLFPVYSVIVGFSKIVTGLFQTIASVMSVVMFFAIGRLSGRVSKITLCTVGSALCISIILVALSREFLTLAFAVAMFGLGTGIIYPTARAAVMELSSKKRGYYIGIYEGITTTGMATGALLGGTLANYIALESPYYLYSVMAVVVTLTLIIFYRRNRR